MSQSFNNEKNKKLIIKLKKSKQIKNLDDSAIKILDEGKALEIDKSINIDKLNGLLADLASSNCILNISEKADDINRYFES